MRIDGLVFWGNAYNNKNVTLPELLELMNKMEYDKCVVVPAKPKNYNLSQANDLVGAAVQENKDKLIGVVRVDPWQGEDAIKELDCFIEKYDFKGIYAHPWEENFQANNPIMFPIMDYAQEKKLPVIIEGGYQHVSHPFQISDLARRYPDVAVIMTHGGELDLSGFTRGDSDEALRMCSNLMIGTAGLCSLARLKKIINEMGSDRIIYQSQFPTMDPRLEVLRISTADIDEKDKQNILSRNAERLFC